MLQMIKPVEIGMSRLNIDDTNLTNSIIANSTLPDMKQFY